MANTPKISVLIPTYNHAHFLDETIQSVLDQTFTDFELIIVDNQSTDDTSEVVQKYLSDARIRFYTNETNLGLGGNWNKCLEYAKGDYIKYLCSDDKFHPQILERYVTVMDQHPDVAIISCQKQWFGNDVKPKVIGVPFAGLKSGRDAIFYLLKSDNYLGEPSLPMFRRSGLKAGNFKVQYKFIIDWEMWMRLLTTGDCYIIPEVLCYTRKHLQRQTVFISNSLFKQSEEYYLFKSFRNGQSLVSFPDKDDEVQSLIRKKAIVCSKEAFKLITRCHTRAGRSLMRRMLKIALDEKVLLDSLFDIHLKNKLAGHFKKKDPNPLLKM